MCGAGTGAPAPVDDTPQSPVSDGLHPPLPLPAQRAGSRRVGQRHPMQSLCDAHRAPACKLCRGHRDDCVDDRDWCGIAAPGTMSDTLGWCQPSVVRGSARSSGWEACAGGGGTTTTGRRRHRGWALLRRPQGVLGA